MGDLHPIVIPPLETTYKSVKYTCSGEGLYKDGYLYDPHAEKLIPPKNTKPGSTPKELEKKPVAYWKAQCAFRGLNQTGAIADLQLRLREAKKKILSDIKSMETELNKEFKKKNIAARNSSWTGNSVEQKAKMNPHKYLAETFPKGGSGRPSNLDIVVLKIGADERLAVSDAAEAMGLESVSVDAPWTADRKPHPDRWVIIGRTRDAVWNQMRDIEREAARSKQTFSAGNKKPLSTPQPAGTSKKEAKSTPKRPVESTPSSFRNEVKPTPVPKSKPGTNSSISKKAIPRMRSPLRMGPAPRSEGPRTKQTARKSAFIDYDTRPQKEGVTTQRKSVSNNWDVRGSYKISCPVIEEEWGGGPLTLDIYLETRNGNRQLFGAFDFSLIEGIMRFERSIPIPKSAMGSKSSQKRKREEVDDDDDELNVYPQFAKDDAGDYSEAVFYLGPDDKPTARRPTWRYRWRGCETGEGEIQVNADRAVRSITFSENGNSLSGYFKCEYSDEYYFEGSKIRTTPRDQHLDPEAQWVNHSEVAHEYASRARWPGGRGGFGGW